MVLVFVYLISRALVTGKENVSSSRFLQSWFLMTHIDQFADLSPFDSPSAERQPGAPQPSFKPILQRLWLSVFTCFGRSTQEERADSSLGLTRWISQQGCENSTSMTALRKKRLGSIYHGESWEGCFKCATRVFFSSLLLMCMPMCVPRVQ